MHYRNICKEVRNLIKMSKKSACKTQFKTATDSREKWKVLKSLGCNKKSISIDDNILSLFNINDINTHFVNLQNCQPTDVSKSKAFDNIETSGSGFNFNYVTISEVKEAIKKIENSNSINDPIPTRSCSSQG